MSLVKEYINRNYGNKIFFGAPVTKISTNGLIDVDFTEDKVCGNLITSIVIQSFNTGGTMTLTDLDVNRPIMQLLNNFNQPLYMPFDYVTFGASIRFRFDTINVYFSIVFEKMYSKDSDLKIEDLFNNG